MISVDSRGTPGVAPSFEKVVHRRLADVALTDHLDALIALLGKHPDLDLGRVAVRGTGLGGWLAALAVTRRPDIARCGVARDPVVDWASLAEEDGVLRDGIHPSGYGIEQFARLVTDAVGQWMG